MYWNKKPGNNIQIWAAVVEDRKGEELAPKRLQVKGEWGYGQRNLVRGREVGTR